MKSVMIMTDLEGVAGVVSFKDQVYDDGKYYEKAKSLLTAEVNAAVEALTAVGIDQILILDGHGYGAINFEELNSPAKLLHGRGVRWGKLGSLIKSYDATMFVGQHAKAGVRDGNLNHTGSSRYVNSISINGIEIGEIAQWALLCGAYDVPAIFLSGDGAACREAEELIPNITTAAVKEGLGRESAISLSIKQAHSLIKEKVAEAIAKQRKTPLPPFKMKKPFVLEKKLNYSDTDDANEGVYERIDDLTVRIKGESITDVLYK